MRGLIESVGWPAARLAEAVEALASAAGLQPREHGSPALSAATPRDDRDSGRLERLANWLGIEIEPVGFEAGELSVLIRGGAPAVLPLGERHALLLHAGARGALLLAPDGSRRRVPVARLAAAVTACPHAARDPAFQRELAAAGLDERECARVHATLDRERSGERAHVGFLLRASVAAPWRTAVRSVRLGPRLAGLFCAKVAEQSAWILSWWVIGRGALAGRYDVGWLGAWALLLATLVPLQVWALRAAGSLAIDLGAEIRRRSLAGALRMPPDLLRQEGVGRSLGRVLESEELESLALGGGFAALFALVELAAGSAVLAAGASPLLQLGALAVWVAFAALLARRLCAARREWTERRLSLTHDLVESMVGHATRLVQQDPRRMHEGEDGALAAYLASARRMDGATIALTAWIPRGWVLLGVLGLGPAFLGGASTAGLAISVGGVLLAYRALRRLADGLADLTAAAVAWQGVAPVLRAAERAEVAPDPALLEAEERARFSPSVPAVSARRVSFRHGTRGAPVLADCGLDWRQGEKLVLEGASGAGKSTFAAILAGLRAPDSGLVLAGGLDRQTLGEHVWRRRVVLAPQFHENHVFGGSLLFNLLMGRAWPPSPEDVRDAAEVCERLGLGPLIERMPGGLLQWVGETGWRLSHGERARVWIARALLQGADAVIIDEGQGTLDPKNLARVQRVLCEEPAGVLVIAHP